MTVRLLQVGLGPWGRSWAAGVLPEASGVEVVGYVDKDPAANEELGASPFFTDLDEILAVADRQGVVLAIAENYGLFPAVALVAQLVRDQALGKVGQVRVDFRKSRDPVRRERDPIDLAILVQLSIHHFDVMRAVLGQEPVGVTCRTWTPPWRESPAHVSASATIEFDAGTMLTYAASLASRGPDTPWAVEPGRGQPPQRRAHGRRAPLVRFRGICPGGSRLLRDLSVVRGTMDP